jgi:acetate---CoA ligase (ADP-forming)
LEQGGGGAFKAEAIGNQEGGPALERSLEKLFHPSSIAVLGASEKLERIGGLTLHFLLRHGYGGAIYPVNPGYKEIRGLPCYSSVEEIPGAVDLVLIAIPRASVYEALCRCAAGKIPYAVLFSGGYAETGPAGRAEQENLKDLIRRSGIRLVGPNCIGIINVHDRVAASFVSGLEGEKIIPGRLALVTQSGGIGNALLTRAEERSIGLSAFVSSGNELDLEAADFLEYFEKDPRTGVIAFVLESLKDPRRFLRMAERARRAGKPVLVLKVGRSAEGSRAVFSHTGAMSGAEPLYEGLFRQGGVLQVEGIDDLFETGNLLLRFGKRGGNRAAILSTSGGAGALMADLASACGIELPLPSRQTRIRLGRWIPKVAAIANPMDMTTQFMNDPEAITAYLRAFAEDRRFDFLILTLTFSAAGKSAEIAKHLAAAAPSLKKPLAVCWPVGRAAKPAFRILEEAGVPLFFHPERCLSALGRFARFGQRGNTAWGRAPGGSRNRSGR